MLISKMIIIFMTGLFLIPILSLHDADALPPRPPTQSAQLGSAASRQLISPVCDCSNCRTTSEFGPRWGRMHAGHDFACTSGFPIRASSSGVVRFAGTQGAYGNRVEIVRSSLVVLASGGSGYNPESDIETSYSHLSRIAVRAGARVQAGDIIGYCGSTGRSTGSHLHYEVRIGGVPMDPQNFFQGDIQRHCPATPSSDQPQGVEA